MPYLQPQEEIIKRLDKIIELLGVLVKEKAREKIVYPYDR